MISCPCKKSLSSILAGPLQVVEGHNKVSLQPSPLEAEQLRLSQPLLIGEVLHPSHHFCGPPLDPLQQLHVFPMLRAPELDFLLVFIHLSSVSSNIFTFHNLLVIHLAPLSCLFLVCLSISPLALKAGKHGVIFSVNLNTGK